MNICYRVRKALDKLRNDINHFNHGSSTCAIIWKSWSFQERLYLKNWPKIHITQCTITKSTTSKAMNHNIIETSNAKWSYSLLFSCRKNMTIHWCKMKDVLLNGTGYYLLVRSQTKIQTIKYYIQKSVSEKHAYIPSTTLRIIATHWKCIKDVSINGKRSKIKWLFSDMWAFFASFLREPQQIKYTLSHSHMQLCHKATMIKKTHAKIYATFNESRFMNENYQLLNTRRKSMQM